MQGNSSVPDLGLHDIILPPPPSWWPPSIWASLVALLLLISCVLVAVAGVRYFNKRKLQRLAIKHLNQQSNITLTELNTLLKQAALQYYPREQVASLHGQQWLDFLTQSSAHKANFSAEQTRWLTALYQQDSLAQASDIQLARIWLKHALPAATSWRGEHV
ncbi:DUF4381 domain-containing protein [Motilimonas eburnea]|uniref:DUF4381 domain-containing protein n=1 Tax=Motilimonas eburnea TaxID=1737488 RepID=UPI001E38F1F1|nr:DUF4381 domain-containing protein [Motilimonas eburnea]MCE2572556.1 DUF4381 domain-containing protein [Motilimonas eburnea]